MDKLIEKYNTFEKESFSLRGAIESKSLKISELELELEQNNDDKELFAKCAEILDIAQKTIQEKMKDGFEVVSTNALQSVFGDGYNLELEFDRRGIIPEVNVFIKTPDMDQAHDPEDANAGGQKDLIALILRMVVLGFIKPTGGAILKLDEPFAQLGIGDIEAAGKCLKSIVDKFNMQTFLITHHKGEILKFADNVIQF